MRSSGILALAAAIAPAVAYTGFNYGTTHTDGSAKTEQDFADEFSLAKNLAGTNGQFTSARLYTCIQAGTVNTPVAAFAAAAKEGVSLLLGMWASSGSTTITNEIAALKAALAADPGLAKNVAGISVGSEDLYRISPIGVASKAGIGEEPAAVANYIKQVKSAIAGTSLSKVPVGHVDTWTAWVNGSNQAVIDASDFIGFDAYPYFQSTMSNPITSGKALFDEALGKTKAATGGKPVWITETGWPVSGPTSNLAVPGLKNAKTYWDEVGCPMFGSENVWWYTVQDADPGTPSPSFGLVASGGSAEKPLYDLSCKDISSSTDSAPASKSTKAPKDSSDSSDSSSSSEESSTSTVSADGEGSPALGHAGSTGTITGVPGPTGTGSAGGSGGNSTFTVGSATASPTGPAGTSSGTVPSGAAVALAGNAPVVGSVMGLAMALMAVL